MRGLTYTRNHSKTSEDEGESESERKLWCVCAAGSGRSGDVAVAFSNSAVCSQLWTWQVEETATKDTPSPTRPQRSRSVRVTWSLLLAVMRSLLAMRDLGAGAHCCVGDLGNTFWVKSDRQIRRFSFSTVGPRKLSTDRDVRFALHANAKNSLFCRFYGPTVLLRQNK
jgi:hypothetical protein